MKSKNLLIAASVAFNIVIVYFILSGYNSAPKFIEGQTLTADTFIGDDIGQKVNVAVATMGDKQGTIHITGQGKITTPIRLGVGQVLEFGPGTWECVASPCITLDDASQVIGAGVYRTKLTLAPSSEGPLLQSKDFDELSGKSEAELTKVKHTLEGDGKGLPGVKYIKIKELTLYGNKENHAAPANGIEIYGLWYWLEDLSIEHFSGDGLVTQFIPGGAVDSAGNDAMESYFTNIKMLSNDGNGWTLKGPHDSISSGVISANNGGWGIDVQHKEGYYSGGGSMFSNTHLYGNVNGFRTEAGANILAYGIESEANKGVGMLLRSNDSVVQGIFYANGTYGVQIGEGTYYAGANVLTIQAHNNKLAQVNWAASAGYNTLTGPIFPNDDKQKYFESKPTKQDQVLSAGPYAVQYFSGGVQMDSDKNVYGATIK